MASIRCAECAQEFTAAPMGPTPITCSPGCRTRRYRASLLAQRQRLARQAMAAVATGDAERLERVARSTVALLTS
ncbi:MAG: hypothetical protein K0S65_785 [Labilithrix sp.]|jgi:hypothetical protein|nr:hypothetical protein [Labilithrix sp.]